MEFRRDELMERKTLNKLQKKRHGKKDLQGIAEEKAWKERSTRNCRRKGMDRKI